MKLSNRIYDILKWIAPGCDPSISYTHPDGSNEIEFQQCSSRVGYRMIAVPVFRGKEFG